MNISTIISCTITFLIGVAIAFALLVSQTIRQERANAVALNFENSAIDQSREISRSFAKELTLGMMLIKDQPLRGSDEREEFLELIKINDLFLKKLIETSTKNPGSPYYSTRKYILDSINETLGVLNNNRQKILEGPPPHPKVWYNQHKELFEALARFRKVLIIPRNQEQKALYENLIIKDASAKLFDGVAQEGSLLTYLLSTGIYMDEETKSDLINTRLQSESSLASLRSYFNETTQGGDLNDPILRNIQNVEQELSILEEERRKIYAASLFQTEYSTSIDEWLENFHHALEAIREIEDSVSIPTSLRMNDLEKSLNKNFYYSLTIGALLTAVMTLLGIFVYFRVTRPIRIVTDRMLKIAMGERNISLPNIKRDDEIGNMLNALHVFQTNAQSLDDLRNERAAILEQLSEAIVVTDMHGYITDWTPPAEKIFGFQRQQVLGKHVTEVVYRQVPNMPPAEGIIEEVSKGNIVHFETEQITLSHEKKIVEFSIFPTKNKDKIVSSVVGSIRDITHQKNSEYELRIAKEQAEDANKAKTEFLANMSHEIRTPMNGILGMNQLLLESELSEHQQEFARSIRFNAETLMSLINDILDLSKIEAGKIEFDYDECDLRKIMCDSIDLMAPKASEKGVDIIIDYPPAHTKNVILDSFYLRQILNNLISNAVKFTEKGFVTIQVRESNSSEEDESNFTISVMDTGIGIRDEKLKSIFEKFSQADSSSTRKFGGTGLGLAISRQLVELMGGKLEVDSQIGKGSNFHFTLALETGKSQPIEIDIFENRRVLVVDANKMRQGILCENLRQWGVSAQGLSHGQEAISQLTSTSDLNYDMVIMDSKLADMSGRYLCSIIRQQEELKDLKLVLMTKVNERENPQVYEKIGFSSQITKPVRPSRMMNALMDVWGIVHEKQTSKELETSSKDKNYENAHILLAEDNESNQKVATFFLEGLGHKVTIAHNGKEAVNQCKKEHYDVIFMDCQMPEMDGFKATALIRELESSGVLEKTPIIALTAHAMKGDKERCLQAGMDDYMSKPVSKEKFNELIQKWQR